MTDFVFNPRTLGEIKAEFFAIREQYLSLDERDRGSAAGKILKYRYNALAWVLGMEGALEKLTLHPDGLSLLSAVC